MRRYSVLVPTRAKNHSSNLEGVFSFEAEDDAAAVAAVNGSERARFRSGGVDWFKTAVLCPSGEPDICIPFREPLRCRYDDCAAQAPVALDSERITCPRCRKYLGLLPIEEK